MTMIHSTSDVARHLDGARAGVLATRLAEVMGLYQRPPGTRIDRALVGSVIDAASAAGIAEQVGARPDAALPGDETIAALLRALLESPRPAEEASSLAAVLGYERLATLVSSSEPSLRRYAAGSRSMPDGVAGRVHFVAVLVAVLRGSFNEFGIRRWLERGHPSLAGRPPAAVLGPDFDPAGRGARRVLDAALELLG